VIEAISAANHGIPAMVINKGKVHLNIWFDAHLGVPEDWVIAYSNNGWTGDNLGLIWLQKVFIPAIEGRVIGIWSLLVMNGHGSHCTCQFEEIARQNYIVPFWLPAHSSHITQPLDVGVFSSVKQRYRRGVQDLTGLAKHMLT